MLSFFVEIGRNLASMADFEMEESHRHGFNAVSKSPNRKKTYHGFHLETLFKHTFVLKALHDNGF